MAEEDEEAVKDEKSWKRKKLNWLKVVARVPGVVPISRMQVVELYSPKRVNKVAKEKGMTTGLSLDLTTGWNFDRQEDRDLAEKYIREYKPMFVIGSPMCTMFSKMQARNRERNEHRREEYEARLRKAEKHMRFAVKMYRVQLEGGRYFIHEHPAEATSWRLPEIRRLWKEDGVKVVIADQCEYGLTSKDEWGEAPAKKPTRFMTNAWNVAEDLSTRCQNNWREMKDRHRHVMFN